MPNAMNPADTLGDFLVSRRARVTPEQVGLRSYGERRVPGLRREEVASLAGVSVQYYKRLERGQGSGASDLVLGALARALQLDDAERQHLFDLARAASPMAAPTPSPRAVQVRPMLQRLLDEITAPAVVSHTDGDFLAANALGRALYAPVFDSPAQPTNTSRFIFLDPAAKIFYRCWEDVADDVVAILRLHAGRRPRDAALQALIGELSTRSDAFAERWASHDVHVHRDGNKLVHHPIVGDMELGYEATSLDVDPDLRLVLYTVEPGSPSRRALDRLAGRIAAPEPHITAEPERAGAPSHIDVESTGSRP
jgi:transcriptional regulator with XRE-family HTH domain